MSADASYYNLHQDLQQGSQRSVFGRNQKMVQVSFCLATILTMLLTIPIYKMQYTQSTKLAIKAHHKLFWVPFRLETQQAQLESTKSQATFQQKNRNNNNSNNHSMTTTTMRGLDFYIIGWPKCGTSALMKWLHSMQNEKVQVIIPDQEIPTLTQIRNFHFAMNYVDKLLNETEEAILQQQQQRDEGGDQLSNGTIGIIRKENATGGKESKLRLYGMKNPNEILNYATGVASIKQNQKFLLQKRTQLIIGLRHPVLAFESFYNYRLKELYTNTSWLGRTKENVPEPASLVHPSRNWHLVGSRTFQYEIFLKSLLQQINSDHTFPIFWYHMEQIQNKAFSSSLQEFLGIPASGSMPSYIPKANTNAHQSSSEFNTTMTPVVVNRSTHPYQHHRPLVKSFYDPVKNKGQLAHSLDICQEQHAQIREQLITQGKTTADWIQKNIIDKERDAQKRIPKRGSSTSSSILGFSFATHNLNEFEQLVKTFGKDPCPPGHKQKTSNPTLVTKG